MATRIVFHKLSKTLLVTNFKCGYSAINKFQNILRIPDHDARIKKYRNENTTVFIYRDVYNRNISCYLNWCVRRVDRPSWLYDYLRSHMSLTELNEMKNFIRQGDLISGYKIFIEYLPKLNLHDEHLVPQVVMLNQIKSDKELIKINLDEPTDVEKLESMLTEKLPIANPSDVNQKNTLRDFILSEDGIKYKNIIDKIYARDINFISKI